MAQSEAEFRDLPLRHVGGQNRNKARNGSSWGSIRAVLTSLVISHSPGSAQSVILVSVAVGRLPNPVVRMAGAGKPDRIFNEERRISSWAEREEWHGRGG